jgi:flagellar biosynthesis protein FlhA
LQYANEEKVLRVLTINQNLEQKILDSAVETSSGLMSAMDPPTRTAWIKALSRAVAAVQDQGWYPVILCTEAARYLVKSSTDRELPDLVVLSIPEIVSDVTVEAVGEISIETAAEGKLAG